MRFGGWLFPFPPVVLFSECFKVAKHLMSENKIISRSDGNDSLLFKQPFALRAPGELLSHICQKPPQNVTTKKKNPWLYPPAWLPDRISRVSLYLSVNVPWYSEGGKIPVTDSIYTDRNLSKCQPSRGAIILLYK